MILEKADVKYLVAQEVSGYKIHEWLNAVIRMTTLVSYRVCDCLNDLLISGKVKSVISMVPELLHHTLLSAI
jgi:hypothetical protein